MKIDTIVIMSKGAAYTLTGFFAPWSAALAQWANSDQWPPRISWVVLITVSIGSACSAWLAFCSGSWKEYRQQMKADDAQEPVVTTVEPTPPKAEPEKPQPKETKP
jgi:hypothetical protein